MTRAGKARLENDMASKSTFERMERVKKTVAKYDELRRQLKKEGNYIALQRLPRDASPTRVRNMCALTGRTRAVYRKFKISRIMLRELALQGKIPGMRKSSW
jgi:small subunit ribosomal protein S14